MRPKNQKARDQMPALLRRHPGARASQLAQWTQTSQPTISRILAAAGDEVIAIGAGPRRRYYARRALRGSPGTLPLYGVDSQGQAAQVGTLQLIEPQGMVLDVAVMGWPLEAEFADGVWPGLAYRKDFSVAALPAAWHWIWASLRTRPNGKTTMCSTSWRSEALTPAAI